MTLPRVLFAEDEFLIQAAMAAALREGGFEVIEAQDGTQAVALIDGPDAFDLLLTDVQMPGPIDGIQVAVHARQRHPAIPVIVVSGQPAHERRLGELAPRKTFIGKPCEIRVLVKTIRTMLKSDTFPAPDSA